MAEFVEKDSRVKIYKMPVNSGSGPCRNRGIEMAKGEFIAFIDPDDMYASNDCLEKLYNIAIEQKCNIVGGNLLEFYTHDANDAKDWGKSTFTENRIYDYKDYKYSIGYCRFIYRLEFVQSIGAKFPPLRRYQDPVWFSTVMVNAKNFYAVNIDFYLYRRNYQKIILNAEKIDHVLTGMTHNLNLFQQHGYEAHFKRELKELKNFFYRMIYASLSKKGEKISVVTEIMRKHCEMNSVIQFKPMDLIYFIKYGLILLKLKWKKGAQGDE
jgi:glycosyltransferase involved in cell wall biosynthesis